MFFVLSKVLTFLISPFIWISALFIWAAIRKSYNRKILIVALGTFLLFSNDFIINEAFLAWETPPVAISQLQNFETGIVLTGVTNNSKSADDRVYFDKGADRILHTVQLYKLGKIKKILISGGSSSIADKKIPEAKQLRKVFLYCGIPEKALIIEDKSRNTTESSYYTKMLSINMDFPGESLLITSAYHIPRSIKCFKKAGLNVTPYPVDFYSHDRDFSPTAILLPSQHAFSKWNILMHEIVGHIVYYFMGYI